MTAPAWATVLVRGPLPAHAVPEPLRVRGDAAALPPHERSRFNAAAYHARRVLPGALGELVDRELRANADFGVRLGGDGLSARLAAQILAMTVPGADHPGPSGAQRLATLAGCRQR